MKIIGIIPARGGSKGIPRKNIKEFCGKPLIAYIIETALSVRELDRVIVSTEENEIAKIAKRYGAEIISRPEELAKDETPTLPVLQHAVTYLVKEENYKPDIVVLLYATSPLLNPERISEAIRLMIEKDFDSIISVTRDYGHFWIEENGKYERFYPRELFNRQFYKPLFKENGALYITKTEVLISRSKLIGDKVGFVEMEKYESIDIDEPLDFEIAEFLMRRRQNEKG